MKGEVVEIVLNRKGQSYGTILLYPFGNRPLMHP
jgi:hypothetical protein